MSGPTTPCVACSKATPLGGNIVNHHGELGDMCAACSSLDASAPPRGRPGGRMTTSTPEAGGYTVTPTQDLILEVLAARHRLGERLWTFDARHKKAIEALADLGLVTHMHGMVEKTVRASLTDEGIKRQVSDNYMPPTETTRLLTRNRILAVLLEIDQPDAAALATLISHRLIERGVGT